MQKRPCLGSYDSLVKVCQAVCEISAAGRFPPPVIIVAAAEFAAA